MVFTINFLFIPSLLIYYFQWPDKIKIPVVIIFFFFYIRDLLLVFGYDKFPELSFTLFFAGIFPLFIYALTEFRRSRVHFLEILSLLIIFGFSIFLFLSMFELVPQVLPGYELLTYIYLILLNLLLCLSFTVYFLKSHRASLALMLFASFLIFGETSLFFKLMVIEDLSVLIFYPVCHTAAYAALVYYGLNRRNTGKFYLF
ncbi:MAG TPA: hypothetical protein VFM70_11515 [Salinimicrobium sp.]|nr:hypothetical protein [Salinimicrobium sp.]